MKNTNWTKKVLIYLAGILVLFLLALPAEAKPVQVDWYAPYYDQAAELTLPADDQVDTAFVIKGKIDARYTAVLVKAVKDSDEAYYYFPANKNMVDGKVFLRFGKGSYRVEINLVKPNQNNPGAIKFDGLAKTQVENTREGDRRNLLPSWGIESDNQDIINKANEITKGIKGDYLKAKAVHDWVSKNVKYDMEKYNAKKFYDNEGALKALKTGKGLCRDYANLTTALLRAAGIEAKTVLGEAGNSGNMYGHAWNEVKVGDRWISLDTTWDAGTVKNGKFVARFSGKYFDADTKVFNQTHRKTQDAL